MNESILFVLKGAPYGNQNAAGPHDMTDDEWEQHRAEFNRGLTGEQRASIVGYSDGSTLMNTLMRSGKQTKIHMPTAIHHIITALKPLDRDTTVYRFTKSSDLWPHKVGDTYKDRGFVSTTASPKTYAPVYAKDAASVMRIRVPKGTPVAYGMWNPKQGYPEKEIILPPWSHFKITGKGTFDVSPSMFPKTLYDLEYIQTKHGK